MNEYLTNRYLKMGLHGRINALEIFSYISAVCLICFRTNAPPAGAVVMRGIGNTYFLEGWGWGIFGLIFKKEGKYSNIENCTDLSNFYFQEFNGERGNTFSWTLFFQNALKELLIKS